MLPFQNLHKILLHVDVDRAVAGEGADFLEDSTHVVFSTRLDISSLGIVLKNLLILLDILVLDVIVDTVEDTLVHSDNTESVALPTESHKTPF